MNKKPLIYFSCAPSHIAGGSLRFEFRNLLKKLELICSNVPWAINEFWDADPEKTRTYKQRIEIVNSVDLMIALFPTTAGSDSRGMEMIERLIIAKPIIIAVHKHIDPLSDFLQGAINARTSQEILVFDSYLELFQPIKDRLQQLSGAADL